ncbi:MAG: formylglycine-generating enzyme family protein [Bacteroidetes bacterium]|nr:formylglycine-generating enzyme family protein [Bacteroidota bacterium]
MKKFHIIVIIGISQIVSCSHNDSEELILVQGGIFRNPHSKFFNSNNFVHDFYIGRYEVTQREWREIMGSNPSRFRGDNLPVEMVSWYDCVEYCNRRSIREGLIPYYIINKNVKDSTNTCETDSLKWLVTINEGANGYRLPTEIEWEYAASGGQLSRKYIYSGSNIIEEVAWYWRNSGIAFLTGMWSWSDIERNNNATKRVGQKNANELGIYDMSGNVREWCWDLKHAQSSEVSGRVWKGGGWMGVEFSCEISFRGVFDPSGKGPDQGFRICRCK